MSRRLLLLFILACTLYSTSVAGFLVGGRYSPSRLLQPLHASGGWLPEDDWTKLSEAEEEARTQPQQDDILNNQDIVLQAARAMEAAATDVIQDNDSANDSWLINALDEVYHPPIEPDSVALYDTAASIKAASASSSDNFEEDMDSEIAMLVRCNEHPEAFLVAGGRAVPDLNDEQKENVWQLVEWDDDDTNLRPTPFLKAAVKALYDASSSVNVDEQQHVMDSYALARWMTKCLPDEKPVGPHSPRIAKVIGRYSSERGSGVLTLQDFETLYFDTIVGEQKFQTKFHAEKVLQQRKEQRDAVWRDFRNHGLTSPAERTHEAMKEEIKAKYGATGERRQTTTTTTIDITDVNDLYDECEILDWDVSSTAESVLPKTRVKKSGVESVNDGTHDALSSGSRSSHKKLKMTKNDGGDEESVPLFVKDGELIFIDEESCIGCRQCANVAPSSFLMLENGRARTFEQNAGPDIDQAVASCPVSCMHRVSFRELKELEDARDNGDGRTDHLHLNHPRGVTPLHVAGIASDNNHRSSWYHTLKHRCLMSKQCPQKGCYDCPHFSQPGANPYFQMREKKYNHLRAQHYIDSGAANTWRKTAEL